MRKRWGVAVVGFAVSFSLCAVSGWSGEQSKAQKRILMDRGEKVSGSRLELVRRVIESYKDCGVLASGNELTGVRINGKLYQDFTLVVRDAKRTIIVATPDGVVSFDY